MCVCVGVCVWVCGCVCVCVYACVCMCVWGWGLGRNLTIPASSAERLVNFRSPFQNSSLRYKCHDPGMAPQMKWPGYSLSRLGM